MRLRRTQTPPRHGPLGTATRHLEQWLREEGWLDDTLRLVRCGEAVSFGNAPSWAGGLYPLVYTRGEGRNTSYESQSQPPSHPPLAAI